MFSGISISGPRLGNDTRRNQLLKRGQILIEPYPSLSGKAHIGLVTDLDISGSIRTRLVRGQYRVSQIKKTPTNWWEAASLFLAREMAARGRIKLIER